MKINIYPGEQMKHYLIIDVASVVFLFSLVLGSDSSYHLSIKFLLLFIYLVSFYCSLWYRDGRLLISTLIGLITLTLLGIDVGVPVLVFGFVFADLLGRAKAKWHIGVGIGAIALMFLIVPWKNTNGLFNLNITGVLPMMILQIIYPILIHIREKAKRLQGELDVANQQLEKYIQQEERQRIARDLHDTLGQTLTMIKLKSELTSRLVDRDPAQAKKELNDILATSRTALKQVRELVSDIKFVSLKAEIEQSKKLFETVGIQMKIREKAQMPLLSSVEETMLALSVREAITNVMKHSQASQCIVQMEKVDQMYCVSIIDDGVGVNVDGTGNGIPSMRERMQALGGTVQIDGLSTGGTKVTFRLPVYQQGGNSAS